MTEKPREPRNLIILFHSWSPTPLCQSLQVFNAMAGLAQYTLAGLREHPEDDIIVM